jgi:hypothetical protein
MEPRHNGAVIVFSMAFPCRFLKGFQNMVAPPGQTKHETGLGGEQFHFERGKP